jgi:Rod binding domain-containing protein
MGSPVTALGGVGQAQSCLRKEDARRAAASGGSEGRTPAQPEPELARACQEMESLFLTYLLKEMRATVPKNGLLSGGKAEEIYTSLADAELAKDLAARGGIGISQVLLTQLGRTQAKEKEDAGPATGK